jgi:mono/diheme cytochrome c family protein
MKNQATIPSLVLGLTLLSAGPGEAVDFAKEIRPIFEARCFECHGPEKQKSSFRLDLREAAMKGGSEGLAIVPGKSGESALIEHITAPADDEKRMPPKGEPLSSAEVTLLKRWIDAGAVWPDTDAGADERLSHWAWQPLSKAGETVAKGAAGNPVDEFVRRRLQEAGLTLSPEADRRTLIRRLTFDLHGLPPTPEAVAAFVADSDPAAYETLVDSLLASPHFGERFARHWLDIAHYADTHGFERDKRRDSAWRYRDYVIDAFNSDKPYDRFLQEQIAGDVLWPDQPEAVIATGFLAAGPWDFVGQVETRSDELRRAARGLDLDDMATQVMTATMGMTVNCARCHDHKLDPIRQEEYYQLWSVFAGVKREERFVSEAALKEYESTKATLTKQRDELDLGIRRLEGAGLDLADIVGGGNGTGSGTVRQGLDPRDGSVQTKDLGGLDKVKTNQFAAVKNDLIDGVFIPDGGGGKAVIPISSTGLTVTGLPQTSGQAWDLIRNGPVASQHSPVAGGIDFTKDGHSLLGLHANAGITFDLAAIRKAAGSEALRFTAKLAYFGQEGANYADVRIYIDGKMEIEFLRLGRKDGLRDVSVILPATARFLTLVSSDGRDGIGHDQVGFGDPRIQPHPPQNVPEAERERLTGLQKEREELSKTLAALVAPGKVYGVVPEAKIPEVRLLRRGEPEQPTGEPLEPGAFAALAMLDPDLGDQATDQGRRRAALAEWITHPENPLTRRVIANRIWHWLFGTGLVSTPSDFGLGGELPSHPELLDWLTAEMEREGGSIKGMVRRLVTSATYRQDSKFATDAPGVAVDAGNRLLWRQNSKRIEAEAVRDTVLAVSGKLNPERGGPGFEDFTYEEAYAPIYTYITADEPRLWRRSIYRYLVRTTPSRFMTTLDCPDPANLTPKRMTTTTALQSLALYNNDFMLRQARYFAGRLESAGNDKVVQAYLLAFGRDPSAEEAEMANVFIAKEGLFSFCRALLNANEFLYVD